MYLRDHVDVLREHICVLVKTEDLMFRHLDKKLRADGRKFQYNYAEHALLGHL